MQYDLIKEMLIALGIMGALVLLLAGIFSTPDVPSLTAKQVVSQAPQLLIQNALNDLSGQDAVSTYGPPYNNTSGASQSLAGLSPQAWAGAQIPVNSAEDNVIGPLTKAAVINPALASSLAIWTHTSAKQQNDWVTHVDAIVAKAQLNNGVLVLPSGNAAAYGPLPTMLNNYLALARSGLLESSIDGANGAMPVMDRTKSLLLLQEDPDATYANQLNMTGNQWGIIKETGNYPGAVWLWFYTLLYQIPPYSGSSSADLAVVTTVGVVTIILMLLPFIPGLRSIPKWLGVYKIVWRRYYRQQKGKGAKV